MTDMIQGMVKSRAILGYYVFDGFTNKWLTRKSDGKLVWGKFIDAAEFSELSDAEKAMKLAARKNDAAFVMAAAGSE